MKQAVRESLVIALAVVLTGVIAYVATLSRGVTAQPSVASVAIGMTLFAAIPPLFFRVFISNAVTKQLSVVGWRFSAILVAFAFLPKTEEDGRNCFIATLLACYLVAIALESGLLIREASS